MLVHNFIDAMRAKEPSRLLFLCPIQNPFILNMRKTKGDDLMALILCGF